MRTMLILVLLCSLAQFAIAQRTATQTHKPEGCGTIYTCYAPSFCTDLSKTSVALTAVLPIDESILLTTDCPALVKFYGYAKHWAHVSIESLVDSTKEIEFVQSVGMDKKAAFSCKKTGTQLEGSYMTDVKNTSNVGPTDNIKCEFDVKIRRNDQIFVTYAGDEIEIKVDTETTRTRYPPALRITGCDPSNIVYKNEMIDSKKTYMEVTISPVGKFCSDPYIMEYRAETENTYAENIVLTCDVATFKIGGTPAAGFLNIRCAALAKFFCDYDVKGGANKEKVIRMKPVYSAGIASELKCPPTHPHLFVDGKPMLKKEIQCLNYGGETSWTVGEILLGKNGPEVHCEKIIQCELLRKITEKSVRKGKVGIDFLPECQREDGTLFVEKQKVTDKRCDESTGEFKYTIGGEEKVVDDSTIFECEYPAPGPSVADIKNQRNSKTFKTGAIAGGLVAAAIVIVTIVGMSFYARNKLKKERMAAEAINKAQFLRFGIKAPSVKPADVKEDDFVWNKLMMSFRYISSLALGEAAAIRLFAEEYEKESEGQRKKNAAQVKIKYAPKDDWLAAYNVRIKECFDGEAKTDFDGMFVKEDEKKPDNEKNSEKKQ